MTGPMQDADVQRQLERAQREVQRAQQQAERAQQQAERAQARAEEQAARAMEQGQGFPVPPTPPTPPQVLFTGTGFPGGPFGGPFGPSEEFVGSIVAGVLTTIVLIAVGIPFVRALGRKWDREAKEARSADAARLDRIERAIEAVALEVERIGEGQRFATKVMAEMRALPSGDAANVERALLERAGAATARERAR